MLLQDIVHKMRELVIIHKKLLDFSLQKTQHLVNGNTTELSALLKEELKVINNVRKIEEERLILVNQYAKEKGLSNNVTFSDIIAEIKEPQERQSLEILLNQLMDIVKKLKDNNDLNVRLTKDSLTYINNSLNMITSTAEADNGTYQRPTFKSNGYTQNAGRSFFDSKI